MKDELQQLIKLQTIDSEISGFDAAISRLQQTLSSREESIREKREQIAQLRNKHVLLHEKQQETKIEHDELVGRVKDRQNKMMQIQTNREHQALLKEIEDSKKSIKEKEDLLLQCIEQIELVEKEIAVLETSCTGEEEELAKETAEQNKAIKQIETSKKRQTTKRDKEAAKLNPKHLQRYDMLLEKRNGLAVVAVYDSVCRGCNMTLPPQQINEVHKAERIHFCATCQRILYYQEVSE